MSRRRWRTTTAEWVTMNLHWWRWTTGRSRQRWSKTVCFSGCGGLRRRSYSESGRWVIYSDWWFSQWRRPSEVDEEERWIGGFVDEWWVCGGSLMWVPGGAVGFALSALCCVDIGVLMSSLLRRCFLRQLEKDSSPVFHVIISFVRQFSSWLEVGSFSFCFVVVYCTGLGSTSARSHPLPVVFISFLSTSSNPEVLSKFFSLIVLISSSRISPSSRLLAAHNPVVCSSSTFLVSWSTPWTCKFSR